MTGMLERIRRGMAQSASSDVPLPREERKRRASNANASNSSTPAPSGPHINPTYIPPRPAPSVLRVHSSSGKGTRFKSSPLGGGERAGVVIAEQVKAAKKGEDVQSPDQEQKEDKQMGFGKD
jgi:metal transporter CNNM